MKKPLILLTLILSAGALDAAELTGKWKAVFDTQVGKQSYVYDLKADGGKVTGKASGDINGTNRRTVDITDGQMSGDTVTFVETFEFQGNQVTIRYRGTLAGDEIRFTREVGEIAKEELVAHREKPAAAAVAGQWQGEFDSPIGRQKYLFDFEVKGADLRAKATAEANGQKRDVEFREPKLQADSLAFVEMRSFQGNEVRIEYTGTDRRKGHPFQPQGRRLRHAGVRRHARRHDRAAAGGGGSAPAGEAPRPRRGGFGGPIVLNEDDKPAFPPVPEGFDQARDGIAHGKLEMVEYDSKSVGTRRKALVYTPPGYSAGRQVSRALSPARHRR
jgi:hypothetical protein